MRDIPAAHSMDSCWFAVDQNGEIGFFETGEGGAMFSDEHFPSGGEAGGDNPLHEHELFASALMARAAHDERLRAVLPATTIECAKLLEESFYDDTFEHLLREVGIWTYSCDEQIATPYKRGEPPRTPIQVSDLEESMRVRFAQANLPVRFESESLIAPGRFGPVVSWGEHWVDVNGDIFPEDGDEQAYNDIEESLKFWDPDAPPHQPAAPFTSETFVDYLATVLDNARRDARTTPTDAPSQVPSVSEPTAEPPTPAGGVVGWLKRLFRS